MPVKANGAVVVAVIIILIAQLFVLYFIKYSNQSLSLTDINFTIPGNILNLAFTIVLLTGVIIYTIRNRYYNFTPVIVYTIVTSILLFLCFLTLYIKIPSGNIYIFDQTLNKFIIGSFFSIYQYVLFMFISFLWLNLFAEKDFILLRVIFNSSIIVILLLLGSYFYIEIKMNSYSENWNYTNDRNIAVVLGAAVWSYNKPSPTLASRADKAVKMYRKEIISKIQVTGGNAPGELSEAEVALNYILKKDVDSADIFIEDQTTSTSEQIRFVKNTLVASRTFDNIFIISDQYHLVRASEIGRFYNLNIIAAASELELSFENKLYNRMRESIALAIFWCFAL